MKAENYLYFAKDGNNDAAQDCLMFPAMEKFAQLTSGNRSNTNNFTVIKDLNGALSSNEGAISSSGISDVTAITVTMTE